MSAVDETPRGVATEDPRPLPSVGIPLLRDEVRTARRRHARLVGLVLAVVSAVGLGAYGLWHALSARAGEDRPRSKVVPSFGGGPPPPPADAGASRLEAGVTHGPSPHASAEPASTSNEAATGSTLLGQRPDVSVAERAVTGGRREARFGTARSFRDALLALGVARDEVAALERALQGHVDFRRCHAEDRLVFERDASGRAQRFEYHAGPVETVVAVAGRDGWSVRRVERPVQRVLVARGGVVRSSLGDALETAGLGRSVTGAIVEAFEGKANFAVDAREGDLFRILVDEERVDGTFVRWGTVHAVEYHGARTGRLRAFWFEPRPGRGEYFDESARPMQGGWLRTPLRYDMISSRFNPRRMHPILRRIVPHEGVDYAAPTGTPVWAAADGVVAFVGERGPSGNLVVLRHEDGYETHYAHLSRFERGLREGDVVVQRQVIGYVGSTGRSTGPHLHFALSRAGRFIDPLPIIHGPARPLTGALLARFRAHARELATRLEAIALDAPAPRPERRTRRERERVAEQALD
ncbi:MAG: M23 family metallopeptidase [Myxococcota bacterium]|nr:M23 family metallopeptidase [Myxococcota bacterium]MDW8361054.1 M23 family metallopeptidase [Myxococcales bacterium]